MLSQVVVNQQEALLPLTVGEKQWFQSLIVLTLAMLSSVLNFVEQHIPFPQDQLNQHYSV
jgi:hypothetical protein